MKKINLFIAFGAAIALIACAPKTAEVVKPLEKPAAKPSFPTTEIAEGSKLYQENCGKCHKLKAVTNYSTEEWQKIVPRMAKKAKIDATAESKVLAYVLWGAEQK